MPNYRKFLLRWQKYGMLFPVDKAELRYHIELWRFWLAKKKGLVAFEFFSAAYWNVLFLWDDDTHFSGDFLLYFEKMENRKRREKFKLKGFAISGLQKMRNAVISVLQNRYVKT